MYFYLKRCSYQDGSEEPVFYKLFLFMAQPHFWARLEYRSNPFWPSSWLSIPSFLLTFCPWFSTFELLQNVNFIHSQFIYMSTY